MKLKPIIFFVLFALASCSGDVKNASIRDTAVYIDPTAASGGDGSLNAPYNSWSSITFVPGSSYLQKKGTIAREQITVPVSGSLDSPITLGAYGDGALPVIQGSEIEAGWSNVSGSVYSKQFTFADTLTEGLGVACEDGDPLAFVVWNTDEATTLSAMSAGSFSRNPSDGKVYIRSSDDADPDTHIVEVSRRYFGIRAQNQSYLSIKDLHIRFVSMHGMAFENCSAIAVSGCTVEKLGGGSLGALYAGNGIEFGNSCSNCTVSSSTARDIFDSGFSPQIYSSNHSASGITFENCTAQRCGFAGFEVAVLYNSDIVNCTMSDIALRDCTAEQCGNGWSGVRYTTQGRGIKINADIGGTGTRSLSGVTVEQCRLVSNAGEGIFISGKTGSVGISRTLISGNSRHGILAQEASATDMRIVLSSSVIRENGGGGSFSGVTVYAPNGSGYTIVHNTFYNNSQAGLADFSHGGTATIINNLFHSVLKAHLYIPSSAYAVHNNYFTEYGSDCITYNGSSYATAASFEAALNTESNIGGSDPLVDSTSLDLKSGSSCIGNGKTGTGISVDFSGKNYSAAPAIGGYEL